MPELDRFDHPLNPQKEFVVNADPQGEVTDFDGFDNVVILSDSGAIKVDAETAQADLLRYKPRLTSKTLEEIVHAAKVSWALNGNEIEGDEEEFDEDGVKKGSHFEGDF